VFIKLQFLKELYVKVMTALHEAMYEAGISVKNDKKERLYHKILSVFKRIEVIIM
jgi:hypothetical protein